MRVGLILIIGIVILSTTSCSVNNLTQKQIKVNLKPGMIISNEPGYYKEGYFGIRIENLIYIKKNRFEGILESKFYICFIGRRGWSF